MTDATDAPATGRELLLRWGVNLAALEAAVLASTAVIRGNRATAAIVVVLALKLAFCLGALRRGPGSYLALLFYETMTLLTALVAPGVHVVVRALAALTAGVTLVLLGASARLFPPPTPPTPPRP